MIGAAGSGWLGFGAQGRVAAGTACDDYTCPGACRDCGVVCAEGEYGTGRGCVPQGCPLGQTACGDG